MATRGEDGGAESGSGKETEARFGKSSGQPKEEGKARICGYMCGHYFKSLCRVYYQSSLLLIRYLLSVLIAVIGNMSCVSFPPSLSGWS